MNAVLSRFPSRRDSFLGLGACVFVIQLQVMVSVLMLVPSLIMRMNLWDTLGVLAYQLAYALLESIVVWGILLLLAALLPIGWYRDHFVPITMISMYLSIVFIFFAYQYVTQMLWTVTEIGIWLLVFMSSLLLAAFIIHRFEKIANVFANIVSLILPLAVFYMLLDIVAAAIILIRNI